MIDDGFTAEERRWLRTWDEKQAQVASRALTEDGVCQWAWKDKVLNAINVTIQRIKRSERPGMDRRRHDNTWVTLVAERGRKKEELSPLAMRVFTFVYGRLKHRGHEFDVDWMVTTNGVVVISINIRALRDFMARRAAGSAARD